MKILQFKMGGEYSYNVTFETVTEKRKVQTNESPTNDLLSVVSGVVVAAIKYFRFDNISPVFRQITFGYPDNGPECFVLELTIRTKENVYVTHTLKSERLILLVDDATSNDTNYQLRIDQKNDLVEKIKKLREEIEAYVLGARMQQDLQFGDEGDDSESGDAGDELFDGEED